MKKRLFSTLTALLMVLSSAAFFPAAAPETITAAAYAAHTRDEAVEWVRSQQGKSIDYDGAYGYQCVDLIKAYYNYLGVSVSNGNGKDYATNSLPSGWTRIQNTADFIPEPGDIVVWTNGTNGHVAIFLSGDENNIYSMDQNWGASYCQEVHHGGYNGVWGVIRPDWSASNQNPIGYVDEIEGWNGKIHVRGWAFDPDDSSESLQIHVYIGGPAGSGAECYDDIIANKESSDVNNAYGIAGSHRFDAWINTNTRGDQPVYIYAINNEGGHNPDIGSGNAYISTSLPDDFHAMIVHSGSNKPIMQNDSGNVVLTSESRTNYDATLWHIMANGDGSYSIYSHKNGSRHGKALTVNGYSDSDGTKLICYTNSSNNGQKFKIISRSSDETLKLVPLSSKSSDRCLELANGSTSDGTPVQIRTANGTAPQKFIFKILDANKNKIDYKLSADKTSVEKGTPVTITVGGTTPYVVDYEFHIIDPDGKETVVDKGCNPVYTLQTEKTGNYKVYAILNNLVNKSDLSAAKNKAITINSYTPNRDPVGYLERVEFENGKIRVKGWAYDPDDSSKSLPIHVYIGGKAGSGAECHVIKSAVERSDVNSYYKISGIHGFDEWMETSAWGETPVYVYAINNEGGYNPCIGNGTVTVDKLESFNDDPSGAVDRIEGDKGKIHVKGWAYDPDCNGKSLQIHVYIGGKAGSGAHCYCITADVERPDINSYRRIPGDHGFDAWIETPVYGEQPVYIYAINNEGGNNPCIGNGTVTIEKTESDTNLTIYYNANGGSTNNSDYSILSNGKIYKSGSLLNEVWANGYGHPNGLYNASTLGLYREGYEFMGWSLTPDADRIFGEDEKIISNDLYPDIAKADASIELYARWKAISVEENNYPVVSYTLSPLGKQFRLKWTAVEGAEKYGIAVYQSGGWRVKVQVNSNTTSYTSPKMKSGSYKMVVCAKINGNWDTSSLKSRAFNVKIA